MAANAYVRARIEPSVKDSAALVHRRYQQTVSPSRGGDVGGVREMHRDICDGGTLWMGYEPALASSSFVQACDIAKDCEV